MAAEAFLGHLPRRGQHGERDWQVESGALLPQLSGSEVHGQPPVGPVQLGGGDPAADALFRLLTGAVGEPDDGERRDAVL
jgi:hypothetical protein